MAFWLFWVLKPSVYILGIETLLFGSFRMLTASFGILVMVKPSFNYSGYGYAHFWLLQGWLRR